MPIEIPETAAEVENRAQTDVQRELPESNPFLKNSWLLALVTSFANRVFDFYLQLKAAISENFPDTATDTFLERWAAIWGKQRIAATQATGSIVATGTATTSVVVGTVFTGSEGNYTSTSSATISAQQISVSGIVRSGQTATATTVSAHGLANNVLVTISGAVETAYNIIAVITVTGLDTFEYQVAGTPTTPATGTILADFTSASVPVSSDDFGLSTNLAAGTELTLQSPIVGVDDTLAVDFGAIGGGTDQETNSSLRDRMLSRIQDPVAHFNAADIIDQAKEVAGVTRVFVQEAGTVIGTAAITSITRTGNIATVTLTAVADFQSGQTVTIAGADQSDYNITAVILVESPTVFHYIVANTPVTPATGTITSTLTVSIGQVRIFFMRDNDDNPIPTGSEVATVRAKIEEILPAATDDVNDLIVLAPTAVSTDFTFTALTPNTSTMQSAINANLRQFFDENTSVGTDIDQDAYRSAIFNTVDTDTGAIVETFTLSTPTTDITIASDEIGTLGNVVYS